IWLRADPETLLKRVAERQGDAMERHHNERPWRPPISLPCTGALPARGPTGSCGAFIDVLTDASSEGRGGWSGKPGQTRWPRLGSVTLHLHVSWWQRCLPKIPRSEQNIVFVVAFSEVK